MKNTICQYTASLREAVKSPEMRHRLHYDWGIYKNREDKHALLSCRLHHECALPLIKLVAIAAMLIAACATLCAIASKIEHLCHSKRCRCKIAHLA